LSFGGFSIFLCVVLQRVRWGICFSFGNFKGLLCCYFKIAKFSIFFLSFWGLQIFCVKFHKWEKWVCAFLLMNFEGLLYSYFENLKFSIFPLVILKVSHGGNNDRGIV
jgi:hypothetical protein